MAKTAVITGAANAIGKEIAKALSNEYNIAFIDFDKPAGEKLKIELDNKGLKNLFYYGDIAEQKTLEKFSKRVLENFLSVDVLINNACVSKGGLLSGCSYWDFEYSLKVGAIAPYYLTKLFADKFSKNACIINVSSTRAHQSQPNTESYTACKGAVTALTHAMAQSLAQKVRVNSIAPGWIQTKSSINETADLLQHSCGRIGQSQDIVNTVKFLIENSFINGQEIVVDGGMSKTMIYHNDHGWTKS